MQTSKYLVAGERDALWGLVISTVGYDEVERDGGYPTRGHADGYYFDTEKGRVLDEFQIVYIVEGEGVFSSEHVTDVPIKAGDIFLLFPGEWHTYRPSGGSVWKSYWIGFKGRNMDDRLKYNFLSLDKPIYHVGFSHEIVSLYNSALHIAMEEAAYCQQMLAGIVNNLIGYMYALERNNELVCKGHGDLINRACMMIRQGIESQVTVQEIAEKLGMSYSNFRKLFKEYTGMSPVYYQQDLRIQRAKELLSSTDFSVKEIAYKLNYDFPDYFSSRFKAKMGCKPVEYRNRYKIKR